MAWFKQIMTYFYKLKRSEEINLVYISIDYRISLPKISPSRYGSIIDKYINAAKFFDSAEKLWSIFLAGYIEYDWFIVFTTFSVCIFLVSYTSNHIISFLYEIIYEGSTQSSRRSCYNSYFFIHDLCGYTSGAWKVWKIYLFLLRFLLVWSGHFQDLLWWVDISWWHHQASVKIEHQDHLQIMV